MLRLRSYSVELLLVIVLAAAVGYFGYLGYGLLTPSFTPEPFSGERAYLYATRLIGYGLRSPGSEGGIRAGDWLVEELRLMGWDVVIQPFTGPNGEAARNIVAIRSPAPAPTRAALVVTHYDTRSFADQDPDPEHRLQPAPGANSGAAGAATLLELARTLDVPAVGHVVCLVFLDGEVNGGLDGWPAALGSAQFIRRLQGDIPRCAQPRMAVYLDLVGAAAARFVPATSADPALTTALWAQAQSLELGESFVSEPAWVVDDAHRRFQEVGIPAVTLTDQGYTLAYTAADTLDRITGAGLERVGKLLKSWLEAGAPF